MSERDFFEKSRGNRYMPKSLMEALRPGVKIQITQISSDFSTYEYILGTVHKGMAAPPYLTILVDDTRHSPIGESYRHYIKDNYGVSWYARYVL